MTPPPVVLTQPRVKVCTTPCENVHKGCECSAAASRAALAGIYELWRSIVRSMKGEKQ